MSALLLANPIYEVIINEFQVAPSDSERVELRYFRSATTDTLYTGYYPLQNVQFLTPAGQSYIDTPIYLPGMGYTVIDTSFLTGNFALPDEYGFLQAFGGSFMGLRDSLPYPQYVPTPPLNCSASKFHFYYWDMGGYNLCADWYVDSTPTFGTDNDDYPGCSISGYVYSSSGSPIADARVIATATGYSYIINTPPYYKSCTTYTAIDGSYLIDSLLPWYYRVKVFATGYQPDSQLTNWVCWKNPSTNLNFYLQVGIKESFVLNSTPNIVILPNPFSHNLEIFTSVPVSQIDIYDVSGNRIMEYRNINSLKYLKLDTRSLPSGIYFIQTSGAIIKRVKL